VDSGGNCISLEAIDPSAIADTENRPENLICGLIDTEIKVDTPGSFLLPPQRVSSKPIKSGTLSASLNRRFRPDRAYWRTDLIG
jgi:hypothetical protein